MGKFIRMAISKSENWCPRMIEKEISREQKRRSKSVRNTSRTDYNMRDVLKAAFEYDTKPIDHGTLETYINCRSCKLQSHWYLIVKHRNATCSIAYMDTRTHVPYISQQVKPSPRIKCFKMLMDSYLF